MIDIFMDLLCFFLGNEFLVMMVNINSKHILTNYMKIRNSSKNFKGCRGRIPPENVYIIFTET